MSPVLRHNRGGCLRVLLCLFCLLLVPGARTQTTAGGGAETATQDRLDDPGWWPTKGTYPRSSFVGNATCQKCHAGVFRTQMATPMADAARPAHDAPRLHQHPSLSFENGPYSYRLLTSGAGVDLSVSNGAETETAPLSWAFGSGELGQTYMFQRDGRWFESRLSLYTSTGQLDITTGHSPLPPESVHDALGRGMNSAEAARCFGCHTGVSTTAGHFEPQSALPGITCEACHGPGADHAKAMATGNPGGKAASLLNPANLSPVDSVDFCGACHRTWADVAFSGASKREVDVVRFQPYRLESSRCWGKTGDVRLTCVACHDPHVPLQRDAAAYDPQCLSCHLRQHEVATATKPGLACPRAADHCTSCHMPRVTVPGMHGEFTDHLIRVVGRNNLAAR